MKTQRKGPAGIAAAAVLAIVVGAWVAPRVFADSAPIAPSAAPTESSSTTALATTSPDPESPFPAYEPTPVDELPLPGSVGYFAATHGVYQQSGSMQCEAVPKVEMPVQATPLVDQTSLVPAWLGMDRMYDFDPEGDWFPLYSEDSAGYADAVQEVADLHARGARETLFLAYPNGWYWGFRVDHTVLGEAPEDPGVVVEVSYSPPDCAGGGGRPFGGPMPLGRFSARLMTYYPRDDLTVIRDLGEIEVMGHVPYSLAQHEGQTPTPTPTPNVAASSTEQYIPTPLTDLPKLGEEGFLSPVREVAHLGRHIECTDTSSVEVPAPDTPSDYPSPVRSWLGWQLLYDSSRTLIYGANEPDYVAVSTAYLHRFPENQIHELTLINSAGGYWGIRVHIYENDGSTAGEPGIYAWYDMDDGCSGGNRVYGGPIPSGLYQARLLSTSNSSRGGSTVLYLGTVEVQ